MMYVLIVAAWFGGYVQGYSISTHDFNSLEACATAAKSVKLLTNDGSTTKVECVPKGDK